MGKEDVGRINKEGQHGDATFGAEEQHGHATHEFEGYHGHATTRASTPLTGQRPLTEQEEQVSVPADFLQCHSQSELIISILPICLNLI